MTENVHDKRLLLALTLTTTLTVGLIGVYILYRKRKNTMRSAAAPQITPEVAKANSDRFKQHAQQARNFLQQALERDETGTSRSSSIKLRGPQSTKFCTKLLLEVKLRQGNRVSQ